MSIPEGVETAMVTADEWDSAICVAVVISRRVRERGFKLRGNRFTKKTSPLARFFTHLSFGSDGCWRWTGGLVRGYAKFNVPGQPERMGHRWAYRWFRGSIPKGYEPHHECLNKGCVNPDHLRLVTRSEHVRLHGTGKEIAARNEAKTHCPRGHEYNGTNTYWSKRGRICRKCMCLHQKAYQARLRERKRDEHPGRD